MSYTITKEQIKKLSSQDQIVEEFLNEWYPEAFKTELEVGKWYVIENNPNYLLNYQGESEIDIHYGFMGVWDLWFFDEYHKKTCREATPEEVETAMISEFLKLTKGSKTFTVKNHQGERLINDFDESKIVYQNKPNDGIYYKEGIGTWLMINGKWAEILPQEKTVVTMEKALKIIAKKYKVSPEQIEINP